MTLVEKERAAGAQTERLTPGYDVEHATKKIYIVEFGQRLNEKEEGTASLLPGKRGEVRE